MAFKRSAVRSRLSPPKKHRFYLESVLFSFFCSAGSTQKSTKAAILPFVPSKAGRSSTERYVPPHNPAPYYTARGFFVGTNPPQSQFQTRLKFLKKQRRRVIPDFIVVEILVKTEASVGNSDEKDLGGQHVLDIARHNTGQCCWAFRTAPLTASILYSYSAFCVSNSTS